MSEESDRRIGRRAQLPVLSPCCACQAQCGPVQKLLPPSRPPATQSHDESQALGGPPQLDRLLSWPEGHSGLSMAGVLLGCCRDGALSGLPCTAAATAARRAAAAEDGALSRSCTAAMPEGSIETRRPADAVPARLDLPSALLVAHPIDFRSDSQHRRQPAPEEGL